MNDDYSDEEPSSTDYEPGYMIDGRYRVISQLGMGGQACVYKVADTQNNDQVVALKLLILARLDKKQREITFTRFIREYQMLLDLPHPNIVKAFDCKRLKELQTYYTMEYLTGGSVADYVKDEDEAPSLSFPEVLRILHGTALALQFAHSKKIIHRDLKPANVLLTPTHEAKVVDFGLARVTETGYSLTEAGTTLGTPAHMSLEQLYGQDVTFKADIYSLGLLAFQMITHISPFEAPTMEGIALRIQTEELPPMIAADGTKAPPWYQRLVEHCTERKQKDRPRSMDIVVDTLEEQMQKMGLLAPGPKPKHSLLMKFIDLLFGNV